MAVYSNQLFRATSTTGFATLGANTFTGPQALTAGAVISSGQTLAWSTDLFLQRDAAGILAQRNGTTAQTLRVYNTFTDASNYERGVFDWGTTANTLTIGTQSAGTGTGRNVTLIAAGGSININNNTFFQGAIVLGWGSGGSIFGGSSSGTNTGAFRFLPASGSAVLQLGGVTASFSALKGSGTTLQARLADDSAFTNIQGKLTTDNAAVTGLVAGALAALTNATLTITDSTGTVYRIPAITP